MDELKSKAEEALRALEGWHTADRFVPHLEAIRAYIASLEVLATPLAGVAPLVDATGAPVEVPAGDLAKDTANPATVAPDSGSAPASSPTPAGTGSEVASTQDRKSKK